MVDSVFLKSPHRIEALMMVITLCLMIYNISQRRLRTTLKKKMKHCQTNLLNRFKTQLCAGFFKLWKGSALFGFMETICVNQSRK
jgi:transposase